MSQGVNMSQHSVETNEPLQTYRPSESSNADRPEEFGERPRLLIAEDDESTRSWLEEALKEQYQISSVHTGEIASEMLHKQRFDLVLSDLYLPGKSGLELTREAQQIDPNLPVIVATAFGTKEKALELTKEGAYHFLTKPFDLKEAELVFNRAMERRRLFEENESLKDSLPTTDFHNFCGMISKSPKMHSIFDLIRRVAKSTANVLILGESGTGKEMIAKGLHVSGPRKLGPFTTVNCASIPENLLESELFGHKKGSFTGAISDKKGIFEEAQNGTLFLDEIGELPLTLQAKLLRAVQNRVIKPVGSNRDIPIDVRIICATHRDLKKEVRQSQFREDLYYRLSVMPVVLPPLRERKEDILLLAEFFLKRLAEGHKKLTLSKQALTKLYQHSWPGNVRELENVVERAYILAGSSTIDVESIYLDEEIHQDENTAESLLQGYPSLKDIEKVYIQRVLNHTGGKKDEAAKILGINRRTLLRKELAYGFKQS
jgi:two-component system response regulator PilR (NtrC family)